MISFQNAEAKAAAFFISTNKKAVFNLPPLMFSILLMYLVAHEEILELEGGL